jgi:hypothetical protein
MIHLKNEITGANDACSKCHKLGHWVKNCDQPEDNIQPKNKRVVKIDKIDEEEYIIDFNKYKNYKGKICYKCGQKGHTVSTCYAKTHVGDGRLIVTDFTTCYHYGRQGHIKIFCKHLTDAYDRLLPTDSDNACTIM